MQLVVDLDHLGPSEAAWASAVGAHVLEPLEPLTARRLVVVSPHPDDEVLGAGGLIQVALEGGIAVEIIAVTDGEASHPDSAAAKNLDLSTVRACETREALRRLGSRSPSITHLKLPDGGVTEERPALDHFLNEFLTGGDLCVAPWRRDGHPDHDACGEAAKDAARATGSDALFYLVWTWHWARPGGSDVPWRSCRRVVLNRRAQARKRWSTLAFVSQISPLGPDDADAPILPEAILRRFWRPFELFVDESIAP